MPENDINIHDVHESKIAFVQAGGDVHGDVIAGDKTITQKITQFIFGDRAQDDLRNRQIMLKRVRQFWVEGVLEKSLHKETLIQLGKQDQSDAVQHPWDVQLQDAADHAPTPLPKDKPVLAIFEEMGRAMLILGDPGSGKTMTLLELARDAIGRAEADPSLPIPVVFNLSSWAERKPALAAWLVGELNLKYQIPKKVAQEWLEHDALLLLLDGLDEVKPDSRAACVKALNAFRQEHGLTDMAVCSRIAEYQQLATQLNLQGAIQIHPLTSEQIDRYFAQFGEDLAALRTAVKSDPALQELTTSPLMLNVMVAAYRGGTIEAGQSSATIEDRRQQVFERYVACMLAQSYTDRRLQWRQTKQPYTAEQTQRWLSWLAGKLTQLGQTTFFMEEMSSRWLTTPILRLSYMMLSRIIVAFLPFILVLSFSFITVREPRLYFFGGVFIISSVLAEYVSFIPTVGVTSVFALLIALQMGIFGNTQMAILNAIIVPLPILLAGISAAHHGYPKMFEQLRWLWKRAGIGLAVGFIVGIGILFLITPQLPWIVEWRENVMLWEPELTKWELLLRFFKSKYFRIELPNLIIMPCLGGFLFMFFSGLTRRNLLETTLRKLPNQGIWKSLRNGILIGLPVMMLLAGVAWVLAKSADGALFWFETGVCLSLFFGGSAWIQHFVLRFIVWANGWLPWNLVCFLDYAADRILLRKVGGGYIFIHRVLLEYFAALR